MPRFENTLNAFSATEKVAHAKQFAEMFSPTLARDEGSCEFFYNEDQLRFDGYLVGVAIHAKSTPDI